MTISSKKNNSLPQKIKRKKYDCVHLTHDSFHAYTEKQGEEDCLPATSHSAPHGGYGGHGATRQALAAARLRGDEATILWGSELIEVRWVIRLDGTFGWSLPTKAKLISSHLPRKCVNMPGFYESAYQRLQQRTCMTIVCSAFPQTLPKLN